MSKIYFFKIGEYKLMTNLIIFFKPLVSLSFSQKLKNGLHQIMSLSSKNLKCFNKLKIRLLCSMMSIVCRNRLLAE